MSQVRKANLQEVLKMYPHVCLSPYEINLIEFNPELKKNFYPITKGYSMVGFYKHQGRPTLIWKGTYFSGHLNSGYIKLALKDPPISNRDWTEPLSIREEGDVLRIYKHMKLKVFW